MSNIKEACNDILKGENGRVKSIYRLGGYISSCRIVWVSAFKEALVGLLDGKANIKGGYIVGTVQEGEVLDKFLSDIDILLDYLMKYGLVNSARLYSVEEGTHCDCENVAIDIYDSIDRLIVQVRLDVKE